MSRRVAIDAGDGIEVHVCLHGELTPELRDALVVASPSRGNAGCAMAARPTATKPALPLSEADREDT